MRAPISVIIPTLNAENALAPCLAALGEGLSEGMIRELIVTDGGSEDETLTLAEAAGARVVTGPASRGGQLKRGTEAAQGDWLLVLHADTELSQGWAGIVLPLLTQPGAYYGRLEFDVKGLPARLVAGWANLRSRVFGLPYGDQALLIHHTLLDDAGGYHDIPLMEDVALARALRGSLKPMPVTALTCAQKYQKQGWLKRGWRNIWTLLRYLAGVSPDKLAEAYRR